MKFFDHATIKVRAGNGGHGSSSMRSEKYVEFGGPDGGNGGQGGNVIVKGNRYLNTLAKYHFTRHFAAEEGKRGGSVRCQGKSGADLILEVPCGTLVYSNEIVIASITEHEQKVTILEGGRGGPGNCVFKTSTNQAPRKSIPGKPGQQAIIDLQLKIIANAGTVGLPNAGKSSFVKIATGSKTKVDSYSFTTVQPHLGTWVNEYRNFSIVDIPGLIKGCSDGKGMGNHFLQHIERCNYLIFVVDIANDPIKDIKMLFDEISKYQEEILQKPTIIALNKCDIIDLDIANDLIEQVSDEFKIDKKRIFLTSAKEDQDSVDKVCEYIYNCIFENEN